MLLRLSRIIYPSDRIIWKHCNATKSKNRVVLVLSIICREQPKEENIRAFGNIELAESCLCCKHILREDLEIKNSLRWQCRDYGDIHRWIGVRTYDPMSTLN